MENQPSLDAPQEEAQEKSQHVQNSPAERSARQPAASGKPTWRTHLALGFAVAAALFSLVQSLLYYQPELFLAYFQQDTPLPSDFVARNERLFRCIFSELPDGEVVGFMTDMEDAVHLERYRITQYVLAPTLVDNSTDHPFLLGVFSAPYNPFPLDSQSFAPIADCGTGIYLLQNNSTP